MSAEPLWCTFCGGPCEHSGRETCKDKPAVFCRNLRDRYEKEAKKMTALKLDAPVVMQHPKNPLNWVLVQNFWYKGLLIPQGFVTDFASIPRLFWSIINPMELGDVGPIVHDWGYRNKIGTRADRDKEFLHNMKIDGISWWKRRTAYSLVRAWGWRSWGSGKVVIEELAPA